MHSRPRTLVLFLSLTLFFLLSAGPSLQAAQTPEAQYVVWKVDSPVLAQLPAAEQAQVRIAVLGREFNASQEDEIAERLHDVLQQLGYFKVIVANLQVLPVGGVQEAGHPIPVQVRFAGQTGDLYRLKAICWINAEAISAEELAQLVPIGSGEVFNTAKVRQLMDAVRSLYAAHGYTQMTLVPDTRIDEAAHTVELTINLDEGSRQAAR